MSPWVSFPSLTLVLMVGTQLVLAGESLIPWLVLMTGSVFGSILRPPTEPRKPLLTLRALVRPVLSCSRQGPAESPGLPGHLMAQGCESGLREFLTIPLPDICFHSSVSQNIFIHLTQM